MRRWIEMAAILLFALLFSVTAFAQEAVRVSLDEVFIEAPDDRPRRMKLEEQRLRVVVDPGTILYFPIENAQRAEDLSGLRAAVRWSKGEELAAPARIEYRQMYDATGNTPLGYRYVVVLAPADAGAFGTMQGEVKVAKRLNSPAESVSFTISVRSSEQKGEESLYRCTSRELWVDFSGTGEWATIEFPGGAQFVVATPGQRQLNIGCSVEPFTDFVERYPAARMRFFCWGGRPIFDHEGKLTVSGEQNEYFYRVIPGGLVDCTGLYSAEAGGFVLETRSLTEFVVSDRPLDWGVAAPLPDNPAVGARA